MTAHLSDLALDRLAARGGDAPHLQDCEACRARLAAFRAERARALADPRFAQGPPAPRSRPMRLRAFAFAFPLAAALAVALVLAPRAWERTRSKGRPFLGLVTERGESGERLRPGSHVGLTLNGAGFPFVLVVARGADGGLEQVWPVHAERSGAIPPGAARLEPPFEVTPGSAHLTAVFSDQPLSSAEVLAGLRSGQPCVGERARAEADLTVEESPR
jgi:hypothetical protein